MANPVDASTSTPGTALLGPARATVVVVASMLGAGVFGLPNSLGALGTISLIGLGISSLGALALAATFGSLARHTNGEGGPFEYARAAFGDSAGFATAWFFWLSAWAGSAAIVVVWVGYCRYLLPGASNTAAIGLGILGLWIPVLVNILGTRWMSRVQATAVILAFVPLLVLCVLGPFHVTTEMFGPFNDSGQSAPAALLDSLTLSAFVFIGVEAVAILSSRVRDPARNVARASLVGTAICAALYLVATAVVLGTVANEELRSGISSFSNAFKVVLGSTGAGNVMALTAVLAGFGGLVGWALLSAELPRTAADAHMFPAVFARRSRRGVPVWGIVISTSLSSVLMAQAFTGSAGVDVFGSVVVVAGIGAGVTFAICAAAAIRWTHKSDGRSPLIARVAPWVAMAFSAVLIVGSLTTKAMDGIALAILVAWVALGAGLGMHIRRRNRTA